MPQIAIRVTDEIYKVLNDLAEESNLTVTDYLLANSIKGYLANSLTVGEILDRLSFIKKDELFTIPSLFSHDEWEKFTSGSCISAGRLFRQALNKNSHDLQKSVEFQKKNSANLAIYKKLTDD
ncbi:DUF1413 domain-containing protein [Sporosarcina sp. FSL K6-1522]|uniref:DUF1413 domain-containing protein n=1 Tax=Sporosarcina sp. FSL K6-1522 TaxID=2921554 RepID=UPI00315A88D2